jgi:hypothetical protein
MSEWARSRLRVPAVRNVGGTPKKKWNDTEDELLIAAVHALGPINWSQISFHVPGRSGKQCRERWLGKLSPDVTHGNWSPDEDTMIFKKRSELGNSWAKIHEFLPHRSIGSIKNRWNWLSRRDVANHAEEFQAIAESHRETARGDVVDAGRPAQEMDIWSSLSFDGVRDLELLYEGGAI